MNDTLQFAHQMLKATEPLRLRLVLTRQGDSLFRQRVVLSAKRLQRCKHLLGSRHPFGRQRSEVDLRKGQHDPLDSTVSESRMPRSAG